MLLRGVACLPRSIPQGHRWFLLKLHLNAPITTARVAAAGGLTVGEQCVFCGVGSDSLAHITQCPAVLLAYEAVADPGTLPHLRGAREALMFQCDLDGAVIAGIVAIFAAVWDIRAAARRGAPPASQTELVDLVRTSVCCPWLLCCSPTRSKSERRARRMREPTPAPGAVIYRSDGASRGQGGSGTPVVGLGSVVWHPSANGSAQGPAVASSRGFLGENVTNNVAEYEGLYQCMNRAARVRARNVIFQVDSMLVAQQLARHRPWACRSLSQPTSHT